MTINQKGRITRRGFLERGARAIATAGVLASVNAAKAARDLEEKVDAPRADSGATTGKIALEEHFVLPGSLAASGGAAPPVDYAAAVAQRSAIFGQRVQDIGVGRIAEMDRGNVELAILSLGAPGIQAIPETSQAVAAARKANDYLAEHVAKFPKRLKAFAALPLQDPQAAAQELTRCVKELGFCGALVNGFSQIGEADSAMYYDLPQYRSFWASVQQLDVPIYLHPRSPLPTRQQAYEGHPWLLGSASQETNSLAS